MATQLELNTSKLRGILQKVLTLPEASGSSNTLFASLNPNQALIPEVANFVNDVTMEGAEI